VLVIAAAVGIAAELTVLPGLLSETTRSQRAGDWVAVHAGSLPQTLDELDQYPLALRRAIFTASSPELQSSFWREQLQRIIEDRKATLSTQQRQFLERAIAVLSKEAYASRRLGLKPSKDVETLCAEAKALFPGEAVLFSQLGSKSVTSRFTAFGYRTIEWARSAIAVHAFGREGIIPDCDCSVGSWCTCSQCHNDYYCHVVDSGCGCFWVYECDGAGCGV